MRSQRRGVLWELARLARGKRVSEWRLPSLPGVLFSALLLGLDRGHFAILELKRGFLGEQHFLGYTLVVGQGL